MPKDEIDPEDPLELRGVALLTDEDTHGPMAECFIEEFMRLGYNEAQILSLFRNPHYTGPHLVFQSRGDAYVRAKLTEVFGWWKRPHPPTPVPSTPSPDSAAVPSPDPDAPPEDRPAQRIELDPNLTDPSGAAIPHLHS